MKAQSPLKAGQWDFFWRLGSQEGSTTIPSWSKRRILRRLAPFIRKEKVVLDAGCGTGFFSKFFCDQGLKTFSLDYSEEALVLARKTTGGRANIIKTDLLCSSLGDALPQKVDIIFSDGLFEHFSAEDQDKIFRNFCSVLTDEGIIITFVPNRWSPWQIIRPFMMPGIKEVPLTLRKLVMMNQRNGMEVTAKGGINVFPIALSPEKILGALCGMLVYTIAVKKLKG